MGVPKFYRWISERYPCLSEVINEQQIPDFDNLYLDMNGIIHNCSHPNDDDVTFRITEEQIFTDIFTYIENLYRLIKPNRVFFMAIDGVAPRAKMNQQRARRFMSARTAQLQLQKALSKGEQLPTEQRFDSNCITPGTYFMTKLHKKLVDWAGEKVKNDPLWQGRRIYISGHNCPGEGEHKIMDFIRAERASKNYDPNTRHCMYGLDADLVMLGICSHEPHFSLLREEVKFTMPNRKNKAKTAVRPDVAQTTFHLLHLSLFREYLAWEFSSVKSTIDFQYDMERVIDDWVLMGFLVGNDFLPHLPHVHIHDDALPLLYETYKTVLPTLGGYLNEGGYLNLPRFQSFLKELGSNDRNCFLNTMEDEAYLRSKKYLPVDDLERFDEFEENGDEEEEEKGDETCEDAAFISSDDDEDEEVIKLLCEQVNEEHDRNLMNDYDPIEDEFNDALALTEFMSMDDKEFENNVEACWSKTVNNSFKRHKKSYYSEKMKYKNISKTELKDQAEGYIRGIQWNLHYYYHGCASWSWFYPHHYAPYISDVIGFTEMDLTFDLSKPFQPFEQLLAVLPAASGDCLPAPLRELMCDEGSPIFDFYPTDFKTDLNGKKNEWEAVVLIPFIDEKRLLEAMEPKMRQLSHEEHSRNEHGGHVLYMTREVGHDQQPIVEQIGMDVFRIVRKDIVWGLLPNVKLDVYFPGFPTMKHLPHTGSLKRAGANVFGIASRKESMVLTVDQEETPDKDLLVTAYELLGEEVFIDWPILKLGKVESICGNGSRYEKGEEDETVLVKELTPKEAEDMKGFISAVDQRLMSRYAIEVRGPHSLVWVRRFVGLSREKDFDENGVPVFRSVRQYAPSSEAVPVLLSTIVKNVLLDEGRMLKVVPIEKAFPVKSFVWVMDTKSPLFGLPSIVEGFVDSGKPTCKVKLISNVLSTSLSMKDVLADLERKSLRWMSAMQSANLCQMPVSVFSSVTGCVMLWKEGRGKVESGMNMHDSKLHIGLNLKLNKRFLEAAEFTRKVGGSWVYSTLTIRIITDYKQKFPEIFAFLSKNRSDTGSYYADEIWPNDAKRKDRLESLKIFLEQLPQFEMVDFDTQYADRFLIAEVAARVANFKPKSVMRRIVVDPSDLYSEQLSDGKSRPDAKTDYRLLDRVVCVDSKFPMTGANPGTVVGIYDNKVDVIFDREFPGGVKIRGSAASGYRLPVTSLINISYGLERKGKPSKVQREKEKQRKQQQQSNESVEKTVGPYMKWQPRSNSSDTKPQVDEFVDKRKSKNSSSSWMAPPNPNPDPAAEPADDVATKLSLLGIGVPKKKKTYAKLTEPFPQKSVADLFEILGAKKSVAKSSGAPENSEPAFTSAKKEKKNRVPDQTRIKERSDVNSTANNDELVKGDVPPQAFRPAARDPLNFQNVPVGHPQDHGNDPYQQQNQQQHATHMFNQYGRPQFFPVPPPPPHHHAFFSQPPPFMTGPPNGQMHPAFVPQQQQQNPQTRFQHWTDPHRNDPSLTDFKPRSVMKMKVQKDKKTDYKKSAPNNAATDKALKAPTKKQDSGKDSPSSTGTSLARRNRTSRLAIKLESVTIS